MPVARNERLQILVERPAALAHRFIIAKASLRFIRLAVIRSAFPGAVRKRGDLFPSVTNREVW